MKTWLCAAVTAAALTAASSASAMPINFQGSTTGCFGAGCTPGASDSLFGLTYTGATINANTSNQGQLGLGGNPGSGLNNLGTFSLTGSTADYNNSIFNLRVLFTAPSGTSPAATVFSSVLLGSVTAGVGGGIDIDFDNSPRNYVFDGGSFTFLVRDVSINAGQSAAASGFIQATAVPGPIAGAGLPALLGLAGLVWARRRKTAATA